MTMEYTGERLVPEQRGLEPVARREPAVTDPDWASDAPPTRDALHRELATWKELAQGLAGELYHVLTSRRWRFVRSVVRLRSLLLRPPEGDPVEAHLNRHLRRAGMEPRSFELGVAPGLRIRRTLLSHRGSGAREHGRLLTGEEKVAAALALRGRSQAVLVSVVMPTWNRGDQIAAAIRSVQAQSYENWELLVVDDGSTDATSEVVERLSSRDERIRYLPVPHGGVSVARDAGLQSARGELIAYLDSDNAWDPDYLLFVVNAIHDSGRICAYSALRVTDYDHGNTVTLRKRRFDYGALLKDNYIDLNVFIHRAELYHELGGFDPELRRWEDWDLLLRYARKHPPEEVPIVLCDYRREKRLRQLTLEEPSSYKLKVLNKHLIDWQAQRRELRHRRPGLVSVVVLSRDRPGTTETCVRALLAAGGPELEVVVVDDGSAPLNRRNLRSGLGRLEDVLLLENYERFGFALGRNLGAAAARGEYVIWLKNGIEVTRGWPEALVQPLRDEAGVGIVGELPPADEDRRFHVLAVRASDVVELRGFDPIVPDGSADLDFCRRMQTVLGRQVLYKPAAAFSRHDGKAREGPWNTPVSV